MTQHIVAASSNVLNRYESRIGEDNPSGQVDETRIDSCQKRFVPGHATPPLPRFYSKPIFRLKSGQAFPHTAA